MWPPIPTKIDAPFLNYRGLLEAVQLQFPYPMLKICVLLQRENAESSLRFLKEYKLAYEDMTNHTDKDMLVLEVTVPREQLSLLAKLPMNWVRFQAPSYLTTA